MLGSGHRLLILLGERLGLLELLGIRLGLLVLLGNRHRLLILLLSLGLILGSLIGVLRGELGNAGLYELLGLGFFSGVVVGVDTNGLTRCHDKLKADTQHDVAEYSLGDERVYTVTALEGERGDTLEQQENRSGVICYLYHACRQEVLTVCRFHELSRIGVF